MVTIRHAAYFVYAGRPIFASDRKRRRRRANALYEFEKLLREEGLSDFVHDEEKDLFRFPEGRFAFSTAFVKNIDPIAGCKHIGLGS